MSEINKLYMEELIKYMENAGFEYDYDVDMENAYFNKIINGEHWLFALVSPHDGNKNRWMLRAETKRDFDRWSVASFEEFYDTVEDFIKYALLNVEKIT